MSTAAARQRGPLDGIKVLDFTHGVAGPYCSMILGDLGADIIKIEKPRRGDPTRYMNVSRQFATDIPRVGGDYFLAVNRNKRSVTVDMKTESGRKVCLELAKWADVAIQNFRPSVMERIGLGFKDFHAINSKLIYANLSAYGGDGSMADKPGMDVAIQARSGVMRITGAVDSTDPVRPGVSLADFGGGIFLVTGILAALFDRERFGEGQEVNVSLLDATMSLLSNYSVAVMDGGAELGPMGSGHPQLVPYQAFPTSDGFVVVSAGTNKIYRDFCAVIGRPELGKDPRFSDNPKRVDNRAAMVSVVSEVMRIRTTAEWIAVFEAADVPCAPVHSIREAYEDLAKHTPDMVREIDHPSAGRLHTVGIPFKWSAMSGDVRLAPPELGADTDAVLRDVVGYSAATIAALRAEKAI